MHMPVTPVGKSGAINYLPAYLQSIQYTDYKQVK